MEISATFEDMIQFFNDRKVRYLVVGGAAVSFHADPRFTKDFDIWVDPSPNNMIRVNKALRDFFSPHLFDLEKPEDFIFIGVAPNRLDILRHIPGISFKDAWPNRIVSSYGTSDVNWISIEDLIKNKSAITPMRPKDKEDVRILKKILERNKKKK